MYYSFFTVEVILEVKGSNTRGHYWLSGSNIRR